MILLAKLINNYLRTVRNMYVMCPVGGDPLVAGVEMSG